MDSYLHSDPLRSGTSFLGRLSFQLLPDAEGKFLNLMHSP
jgi:hypothetical protein